MVEVRTRRSIAECDIRPLPVRRSARYAGSLNRPSCRRLPRPAWECSVTKCYRMLPAERPFSPPTAPAGVRGFAIPVPRRYRPSAFPIVRRTREDHQRPGHHPQRARARPAAGRARHASVRLLPGRHRRGRHRLRHLRPHPAEGRARAHQRRARPARHRYGPDGHGAHLAPLLRRAQPALADRRVVERAERHRHRALGHQGQGAGRAGVASTRRRATERSGLHHIRPAGVHGGATGPGGARLRCARARTS